MNGKPWTSEQLAELRRWYRKIPTKELAERVGHSLSSTYQQVKNIGLSAPMRFVSDQDCCDFIATHHPEGWSDTDLANMLAEKHGFGVDRHRLTKLRKSLGLPSNARSQKFIKKVRQNTQRQIEREGLPSLSGLRARKFNQWKRSLGWPDDLSVRAVQALETIYRVGPMTRLQLCDAMGIDGTGKKNRTQPKSNAKGGTVLAELQRAGLIDRLNKVICLDKTKTGKAAGKQVSVYFINPGVHPNVQTTERSQAS